MAVMVPVVPAAEAAVSVQSEVMPQQPLVLTGVTEHRTPSLDLRLPMLAVAAGEVLHLVVLVVLVEEVQDQLEWQTVRTAPLGEAPVGVALPPRQVVKVGMEL